MIKNYQSSSATNFFTLGIRKYRFSIDRGYLIKNQLRPLFIDIDNIESIIYEMRLVGYGSNSSPAYIYIIVLKDKKEILLGRTMLKVSEYKRMFKDLIAINQEIKISESINDFLEAEVKELKLKFDFTYRKGEVMKRDKEFELQYPTFNILFGLFFVFFIMPIPVVIGVLGDMYFKNMYGTPYGAYRTVALVISGVALAFAILNILSALVSLYLGHKATIIALGITLLGLLIGFVF